MIKFLQKLVVLWKKSLGLTEIQLEHKFFQEYFAETLEQDEDELRKRLGELRTIKQPRENVQTELLELDKQLTKLMQVKGRIIQSEKIEDEFKGFIKTIKKNLWM